MVKNLSVVQENQVASVVSDSDPMDWSALGSPVHGILQARILGWVAMPPSRGNSLWCRRPGFNPWVRKMPWRRKWQPTPVFLSGESHGQRSLVSYSTWDCRVGHN